MKKLFCLVGLIALPVLSSFANMVLTPWNQIFKGIEHAVGTNYPDATIPRLQVMNVLRIDLRDPDVQLFTSPRAPNHGFDTNETRATIITNFMLDYGLKVATDCNFYRGISCNCSDPALGAACRVYGLSMVTGQVVSIPDTGPDVAGRHTSLLFDTNKEPTLVLQNRNPGTNSSGVYTNFPGTYTAVTGYYPVLTNGWIWDAAKLSAEYPDPTIHGVEPRTCFGISQDRHYLFLMIIDGRQTSYSQGATDQETAMWMLQVGAWDALNMDGGGSTAMYKADCAGNPVPLGHSSYVAAYPGINRERIIGSHFGVHAPELNAFIYGVTSVPGGTNAIITWDTVSNATSQVEYGVTLGYGTFSALDPTPVTSHRMELTGLTPGTKYYYRVISATDIAQYTSGCGAPFTTTNPPSTTIFTYTNMWQYSVDNLDAVPWKSPTFDDQFWSNGLGVLWVDTANPANGNPAIQFLPLRTQMPYNPAVSPIKPYVTYYFRTHFTFNLETAGVVLTLTNYFDDGAAFYLNGVQIHRAFLPDPAPNGQTANGYPCTSTGNATCPYVITVSGDLITNLVQGDNVLAVEVHNFTTQSPDITFGCDLTYVAPSPAPPFIYNLAASSGMTNATISWNTLSNAMSQVEYGLTPSFGNITPLDPTPVTNHSVTLTDLQAGALYYYRAISSVTVTQYTASGTFTTQPPPPPPFITNLVALPSSTSVTISWRTVSNATAQILYGLSPLYGYSTAVDTNLSLLHAFTITGLQPTNTYYFQAVSTSGGSSYTSNSMFVTLQSPIYNLTVIPGLTNATISWMTLSNANAQVQYGLTPGLGSATPVDPTLTTSHVLTLIGLEEATNYYFRVISSVGATQWVANGAFSTFYAPLVSLTNSWNYSTSNLDGIVWQGLGFTETNWPGGPALLWADRRPDAPPGVQPRNTRMPINTVILNPFTTYYFRTWFTNPAPAAGYSMVFSNFVDDGAVFYLNGNEIYRLRMPLPPIVISNGTYATGKPFGDDATQADVFRRGGEWMTNLVVGPNLVAVEVHNFTNTSPDIVFGASIGFVPATAAESKLWITSADGVVTVWWDGKGCTLQQAQDLNGTGSWSDVPGPIRASPYSVTNPAASTFYRLRD